MPYKSEQQRICKWCNDPVKKYYSKGKFKNYLKTCGSIKCLTEQYRNSTVRLAKGRTKLVHEVKCELCASIFLSRGKDGRFCKSCVPSRTWRARAERYAIGKPQWEILVEKQQGKCFLCDLEPKVVDHNHKTGAVRSLLCYGCNLLVGLLERDKDWVNRALKYV